MNYLKTFEKFFKYHAFHYPEDEDLIRMIGIDRQTIEDLFVDFEDKLPGIHISIEFLNYVEGVLTEPFGYIKWDGNIPYDHNISEIDKVKVYILLCPSKELMEELKQKVRPGIKWYDLIVGDKDLSDEIETLKKRLELLGFYNIENNKGEFSSKSRIDNIYVSQDVTHGLFFLSIQATKDVIKK